MPNWRLANTARKTIADLVHKLSDEMPSIGQASISDLEPIVAQRIAGIQLSGLAVRSAGAVLALVGAGYEPEAAGPLRRIIEAVLRIRAVIDDPSGEHAKQWLSGRPQGKVERLAQRYAREEELRNLSVHAHADTRALLMVMIPPGWNLRHPEDGYFDIRPSRDIHRAEEILYATAYETGSLAGALAELFTVTVEIPQWLSEELIKARDCRRQAHENRERAKQ